MQLLSWGQVAQLSESLVSLTHKSEQAPLISLTGMQAT